MEGESYKFDMECGSVFECAAWPRMQMLKLQVTPIMQKILYDILV